VNLLLLNYTSRPRSQNTSTYLTIKSATTQKINQGKKSGNQIHQLSYQKYSCTAPSEAMGRRRRDGNYSPQKKFFNTEFSGK
jgi:hypothetical protein